MFKIIPYFQPKKNLKTGLYYGAEVYLRVLFNNKKIMNYSDLSVKFSSQELYFLDLKLFKKTLKLIEIFNKVDNKIIYSFNLPDCSHVKLNNYFLKIIELLKSFPNIHKDQIDFELMEENKIDDECFKSLQKFSQEFGFEFSLDDFGVAHSNLERLLYCEDMINCIKLDRFLIKNKENIIIKHFIVFISQLGHELGLKVLAEGVETEEELDFLTVSNIEYAQGYYFSPAISPNSFLKLLMANH